MNVLFIMIVWVVIVFCIFKSVAKTKSRSDQHSSGMAAGGGILQRANGKVSGRESNPDGWQNQEVLMRSGSQGGQLNQAGQGIQMGHSGKGWQMNQMKQSGQTRYNGWQSSGSQGQNNQNSQNSLVDRTGYAAQIADNDYGSAADHRLEEANQAKDRAKKQVEMAEVHKGSETTMEEWAQVQKKKKIGYEGRPESKPSFLGGDVERADRIPDGTKVIHCSYCGAGNIVPAGKEAKYHCYFCWERLEK